MSIEIAPEPALHPREADTRTVSIRADGTVRTRIEPAQKDEPRPKQEAISPSTAYAIGYLTVKGLSIELASNEQANAALFERTTVGAEVLTQEQIAHLFSNPQEI